MELPTELWQKINLISSNKLLLSGLNQYFYKLIHELDQYIFEEINLVKTPKFANHLRIYNSYLAMNREDLICSHIGLVKHVKSLIVNIDLDVSNLTQLIKLELYNCFKCDISKLTNLTYLQTNQNVNLSEMVNLKVLGYNHRVNITGDEFNNLINLVELNLIGANVDVLETEGLNNLVNLSISDQYLDVVELITKLPNLQYLCLLSIQDHSGKLNEMNWELVEIKFSYSFYKKVIFLKQNYQFKWIRFYQPNCGRKSI